jgi:hypothetical protein
MSSGILAARYYLVDATVALYPRTDVDGTLGAFIRIRSPILSKRALFDIGNRRPAGGICRMVSPLDRRVALSKVGRGTARAEN